MQDTQQAISEGFRVNEKLEGIARNIEKSEGKVVVHEGEFSKGREEGFGVEEWSNGD